MTNSNTVKQIESLEVQATIETIVTQWDYNQVVIGLTNDVIYAINEALDCEDIEFDLDSVQDFIHDSCLHETIDQSSYAIYNSYHLPIIMHSDNDEYMIDNFGEESVGQTLKSGGLSGLHSAIAFWCLNADVSERIMEHLKEVDFDIEED